MIIRKIKSSERNIKAKKAQQEAVGFVIIILMVLIIGVIFLGISLRKGKGGVVTVDAEISNFLTASSSYTSDCAKDYEPNYRNLGDLTADCYSQKTCSDSRKACEVLNKSYRDILENFRPGGKPLNYYRLAFYYQTNISLSVQEGGVLFSEAIEAGNQSQCSSRRAGINYISLGEGNVVQYLEVCLSS